MTNDDKIRLAKELAEANATPEQLAQAEALANTLLTDAQKAFQVSPSSPKATNEKSPSINKIIDNALDDDDEDDEDEEKELGAKKKKKHRDETPSSISFMFAQLAAMPPEKQVAAINNMAQQLNNLIDKIPGPIRNLVINKAITKVFDGIDQMLDHQLSRTAVNDFINNGAKGFEKLAPEAQAKAFQQAFDLVFNNPNVSQNNQKTLVDRATQTLDKLSKVSPTACTQLCDLLKSAPNFSNLPQGLQNTINQYASPATTENKENTNNTAPTPAPSPTTAAESSEKESTNTAIASESNQANPTIADGMQKENDGSDSNKPPKGSIKAELEADETAKQTPKPVPANSPS